MSNVTVSKVLEDASAAIDTIRRSYQAKEITEEECKELIQDVLDVKRVDELTDDLNLRSDIYKSLKTLYQVTKAVLPFI